MEQLLSRCQCSRMTVFGALKKCGYYSSYNYNAGFYTLVDIPRFDQHGLWEYDDKRFSRFRTLNETLVQLVENSLAGYTAGELDELLGVECRHFLQRLADEQRIVRKNRDACISTTASNLQPNRVRNKLGEWRRYLLLPRLHRCCRRDFTSPHGDSYLGGRHRSTESVPSDNWRRV